MPDQSAIPEALTEHERIIDSQAFADLATVHRGVVPKTFAAQAVPDHVDLSPHLRFIRDQNGGAGCFGYAMLAVWDIMNDIACPYSPNLSMRIWLLLHHRRELWQKDGGIFTPDGRFHPMSAGPDYGLFQSLGNPTEGTELTAREHAVEWPTGTVGQPWTWTGLWTSEGLNEAGNYRLNGNPLPVDVTSANFIQALAQNKPIRLMIGAPPPRQGHFIALVGYDKSQETFTYVDSAGDNTETDGFGTLTFQDVDAKQIGLGRYRSYTLLSAETVDIHPPSPVPAARISFTHTNRSNVHLWLYAENSPLPRNKIWPQGWRENSRNLSYTVRLPSEFVWPPSSDNRLVLELYDEAQYSTSGGQLTEFKAAFGEHVLDCPELLMGPIAFNAREHRQFCIP